MLDTLQVAETVASWAPMAVTVALHTVQCRRPEDGAQTRETVVFRSFFSRTQHSQILRAAYINQIRRLSAQSVECNISP